MRFDEVVVCCFVVDYFEFFVLIWCEVFKYFCWVCLLCFFCGIWVVRLVIFILVCLILCFYLVLYLLVWCCVVLEFCRLVKGIVCISVFEGFVWWLCGVVVVIIWYEWGFRNWWIRLMLSWFWSCCWRLVKFWVLLVDSCLIECL